MVGLCTNVSNIVSTTSANPTACAILDLQVLVNVNIPPHPTPTPLNPAWSRWCLAGISMVSWWCLGRLFAPRFTRLPHDLAWGYCRDIHFSLFLPSNAPQGRARMKRPSKCLGLVHPNGWEMMGTSVKESTSCRSFLAMAAMACYPAQKQ